MIVYIFVNLLTQLKANRIKKEHKKNFRQSPKQLPSLPQGSVGQGEKGLVPLSAGGRSR